MTVTLESRAPSWRGDGMSAMEAVAWLGGERPSQAPRCASPMLAGFVESCNDRWPDAERQLLKPYVALIVGTRSGPADERSRAYLLTDRAIRVWALAAARNAGRLARQWGDRIRVEAERLGAVEPVSGRSSALQAAAILELTAQEVERVADLVDFCAGDGEHVVADAHAGALALAAEAIRSAAYAATALAAGATDTAAGAAIAAVEASEASALGAADARGNPARFNRQATVTQSLAALEALLSPSGGRRLWARVL